MNSDGNVAVYAGVHSLKPIVKMKREAFGQKSAKQQHTFSMYTSVYDQLAV